MTQIEHQPQTLNIKKILGGLFKELMYAHREKLCPICLSLLLTYISSQSETGREEIFGLCDTLVFSTSTQKEKSHRSRISLTPLNPNINLCCTAL